MARLGRHRLGAASSGSVRYIADGSGAAGQGLQTAARSFFGGSLLLFLEGRSGVAPLGAVGRAGRDMAGLGMANADDLSTGGFGLLC